MLSRLLEQRTRNAAKIMFLIWTIHMLYTQGPCIGRCYLEKQAIQEKEIEEKVKKENKEKGMEAEQEKEHKEEEKKKKEEDIVEKDDSEKEA